MPAPLAHRKGRAHEQTPTTRAAEPPHPDHPIKSTKLAIGTIWQSVNCLPMDSSMAVTWATVGATRRRPARLASGGLCGRGGVGEPYEEDFAMGRPYRIAVIGAGYWGPNLVRNFRGSPDWDLVAVCDLDEGRARKVVGPRSTIDIETSVEHLLARDDVDAVAIATPAKTHASLALTAFAAGKHVVVEKPIAQTSAEAAAMVHAADEAGLTLMIDHTYCYTPAVQYIHDTISRGQLGHILYVD